MRGEGEGRSDVETRGNKRPLTDDANSTENAQDCAYSVPRVAATDSKLEESGQRRTEGGS
jgi:hypothetical protein